MIVCLCHAVRDSEVRAAIRDGVRTPEELGKRCGAGTGCGGCRRHIRAMFAAARAGRPVDRPAGTRYAESPELDHKKDAA